jgi:hypothetical protein
MLSASNCEILTYPVDRQIKHRSPLASIHPAFQFGGEGGQVHWVPKVLLGCAVLEFDFESSVRERSAESSTLHDAPHKCSSVRHPRIDLGSVLFRI